MRIDMPNTSVITNPLTQQATVLDHLKLTAQVVPLVKAPAMPGMPVPGMPAAPAMPAMPAMPAVQAQNLGKALIEGHEVEGIKYTMPAAPAMPGVPAAPAPPAIPGMPAPPAAPAMPPVPTVAEVWSSTKLQVPVLTKITGSFGQQTTYCKPAASAEPPPSTFQIPPGYTMLPPPQPPAPPAMPAAPAAPKPPVFGS